MRVLITGSSGFAGRQLVALLQRATNWELYGLSRHPEPTAGVRPVSADLLSPSEICQQVAEVSPDLIFHLAGQASVAQSFQDPATTLQTNLFGQLNLLEAVRQAGLSPRMVVVASNEIYGQSESGTLVEETPLRPANPYAVSKAAQDLLALQYHLSYQLPIVRMRPFNHIGPGQDGRFVLPGFAQQIALIEAGRQEPVISVGNLEARRDFTDVRDIVRGYYLAALQGEPGEAYNLGSGRAVAIRELLDLMLTQSQVAIRVEIDPARVRPIDVPLTRCDASRFRQRTGWAPEIPLEQTIADVLAEWRGKI